ncbi:MAG TPA: DNA gyrase subunit A [Anaerolineaceae bacterium]|uniref:DNA gyrase subunit A n=1 Tax=Anaerolinea thermophila TaxID=167964 RepID=A0A101FXB4_9CHLR|nr:MAG: DNA gyrase subunit A [Anaerolinea thermophila]HAF61679.1 DNA gyrase subunit A [Anaerolineaceae bacterium]
MEISNLKRIDIDQEMRTSYIDYAMSVIVARALPDARDGLKPVHRRILYAMMDMGIRASSSYKKSARIVGEVLGKYHPHGDAAVYDAMARMAQDFSMRYLLVDGQGNFGSIDGDPPAAMRYTEARMGAMAEEMLVDIQKDTVDFVDNFDGSLQEPSVLPARLPNMLLNGASGIAVGMATNIPSHNLGELCRALIYMIDNQDNLDEITVEDLIRILPGPDFPTGGIIVGTEGIRQAYSTGKGKVTLQGKAQIEEIRGGRYAIRITEIPYQVNKTTLIERIAELVRSDRIPEISDLRDESDRTGMRIILELKRSAQPKRVLNRLYKYTQLQSTFGINMLALVDGEPRLLTLKHALQIFIDHRMEVIKRRTEYDLEKARNRAHILEGLMIALANLDDVIRTIRESKDADVAKTQLMKRFKLSEIQAQAILDMQLRRLAALERMKIETEYKEVKELIAYLEDLLAHPKKMLGVIRQDLEEILEKYSDRRRTHISEGGVEDLTEEDLVSDVPALVSITNRGYIKRVSPKVYRTQARGGRGVIGQGMKDEDEIDMIIPCRALHTLLFFSDRGKVYSEKVYQIPEGGRTDKGLSLVNLIALEQGERITAALAVPDFETAGYLTFATTQGYMKRVELKEFESVRTSGLIAISLQDDDELGWVALTSGKDEMMLVTANGQALRFKEEDIRPMGRTARGVIGIRFKDGDRLASMEVVEKGASLLVVTEKGFGKRTDLKEYRCQGRGTQGVATIDKNSLAKIGKIAIARVVQKDDQVTLMSNNGIIIRLNVKDISISGRATRGVTLMHLEKGDKVASVARFTEGILSGNVD